MSPAAAIATLGGLGRAVRVAPGTAASLLALFAAWGLATAGGYLLVLIAAIAVTITGLWSAQHYSCECGTADPSECVIDEVAGQLLACAFAPHTLLAYAFAFGFFRILDILKPWPIRAAERLPGGLGIMADDVIAGVIAGLAIMMLMQIHLVAP